MFSAESAPDWVDGDNCYRCRASFGMLTRKHHCRACGQIFCDKCSSKNMLLPNIGIEKEVRVCESCYEKNKSKQSGSPKKEKKDSEESSPSRSKGAASGTAGPSAAKDKEIKDREEEELAMAIALSQSEADEKERQRQGQLMQLYNGPDSNEASADEFYPPKKKESASILGYKGAMETTANGFDSKTSDYKIVNQPPPTNTSTLDSTDPELARYLNRAYWETRRTEQKQGILRQSPTPSAPPPSESSISNAASVLNDQQASSANGIAGTSLKSAAMDHMSSVAAPPPGTDVFALQNGDISVEDTGRFAAALKNQVEVFVNRIRSNQARGRSIVNDSSIQTLFLSLTNLHSDLLNRMNNLDEKRGYFESLQDRLANIQEARQAVEALREEHEKRRQEEILEAQRRRQIQMQQKLEVMRHKKHEMLEHQRMMALQRMQQQEQEMQMKRQMAAMGIAGTGVMGVQQMMVAQPPGAVQPAVIPQQQMTGYGPPQQWLPQQQQPQQMIHSQLGSGGQPQAASNYEVNPQAQMIGQYNIPAHPPASFPPAPIPQAQPVSVGYFGQTQQEISQSPIPGYHPGVPIVTSAVQPTYVYQQPAPVLPQMMGPVMGQEMQQTHTMVGGQQPAQQIYQGSPAHYPSPSPQVQKEEKHEEELLISFD